MNERSHNVVDDALVNLLRSLPKEVADRVRDKYEEDRNNFLEFVSEQTPSKDPAYWAKHGCTKCYGRGILGTLTKPSGEKSTPACSCTSKNYAKWLVELRKFYSNKLKEQGHETTTAD